MHAANNLCNRVFGQPVESSFVLPSKYTGELLGVEYLFNQTGKALPSVNEDPDSFDPTFDDIDEGIEEDVVAEEETDMDAELGGSLDHMGLGKSNLVLPGSPPVKEADPVVKSDVTQISHEPYTTIDLAALAQTEQLQLNPPVEPIPSTSAEHTADQDQQSDEPATTSQSSGQESGHAAVIALADALLQLRSQQTLSMETADELVRLYNALDDRYKQRVRYQPRFRKRVVKGRFKTTKSSAIDGVDSLNRCTVGGGSGPAQWPSTSPLVEAVFNGLCLAHPNLTRKTVGQPSRSRWQKILHDYHHIREVVYSTSESSRRLCSQVELQLFEVNQTTLLDWHNKRMTGLERQMLYRSMSLATHPLTSAEACAAPKEPLPERQALESQQQRIEVEERPNLIGLAASRPPVKRKAPGADPGAEDADPDDSGPAAHAAAAAAPAAAPAPAGNIPAAIVIADDPPEVDVKMLMPRTSRYRERCRERDGVQRKNKRARLNNLCRHCKLPFIKETGHSGFYGFRYCPTSGVPLAVWRAEAEAKRAGRAPAGADQQ